MGGVTRRPAGRMAGATRRPAGPTVVATRRPAGPTVVAASGPDWCGERAGWCGERAGLLRGRHRARGPGVGPGAGWRRRRRRGALRAGAQPRHRLGARVFARGWRGDVDVEGLEGQRPGVELEHLARACGLGFRVGAGGRGGSNGDAAALAAGARARDRDVDALLVGDADDEAAGGLGVVGTVVGDILAGAGLEARGRGEIEVADLPGAGAARLGVEFEAPGEGRAVAVLVVLAGLDGPTPDAEGEAVEAADRCILVLGLGRNGDRRGCRRRSRSRRRSRRVLDGDLGGLEGSLERRLVAGQRGLDRRTQVRPADRAGRPRAAPRGRAGQGHRHIGGGAVGLAARLLEGRAELLRERRARLDARHEGCRSLTGPGDEDIGVVGLDTLSGQQRGQVHDKSHAITG
jgi:hypothetical protein